MDKPFYHVAVGVIEDADGNVLIAKRPEHKLLGGLWEFPGGKIEADENVLEGLSRELHEELGIQPLRQRPLIKISYDFVEYEVLLDVWHIQSFSGMPYGRENQPILWVNKYKLDRYSFPDANVPIIRAIQLPSVYKIKTETFSDRHCEPHRGEAIHEAARMDCFGLAASQRQSELVRFRNCRPESYNPNTMLDLPFYNDELPIAGLHLNSNELYQFNKRPIPKHKLLGASLHTLDDIQQANKIQCDFGMLSPVKHTPSHPDATPIGWEKFAELIQTAHFPVYALGGMTLNDLETAWQHGAQGIAGIRNIV